MNSHMPCEQRATKEINLQVVGPKCAVHQQGAAMPMLDQQLQHAGLAEHHLKRLVSGAVLRQVAPRAIIEQVWRERVQEFRIHNDLASLDEAEAQMLVRQT
jgi:hypothetical protein